MPLIASEILDNVPIAVIVVDARRRVLHANASALDLLGSAALNRDVALSLRHPDVLDAIDRVLAGRQEISGEISLPVPVPRNLAFHAQRLPASDSTGAAVATVVLTDMTSAKKAEEMRADFVANVSHELRSPLTALIGFIETLRGPASDDTAARVRFLDIMHRESQRMSRLIEDLLTLSRVEINEHVAPRKPVELLTVLRSVFDVLEPRAAARGMRLDLHAETGDTRAIGDSDQLNQVFRNLIENAIKYGSQDSPVTVVVRRVERYPGGARPGIAIEVRDRGPGIPKDVIPRLTERFFRADQARSNTAADGIGSTGLGLAIVKHIVNRHRGHLAVDSVLDQGSVFTVFLPAST